MWNSPASFNFDAYTLASMEGILEGQMQEELRWNAAVRTKGHRGEWLLLDLASWYARKDDFELYRIRVRRIYLMRTATAEVHLETNNHFDTAWDDAIHVIVHHGSKLVRFGPIGNIGFSQPGEGIGSYVFSLVIRWCHPRFPDYRVMAGSLSSTDNKEGNLERRNAFYRNLGFTVRDDGKGNGSFSVASVSHLREHLPGYRLCEPHDPRVSWFVQRCLQIRKEAKQCRNGIRNWQQRCEDYEARYYRLRGWVIRIAMLFMTFILLFTYVYLHVQ